MTRKHTMTFTCDGCGVMLSFYKPGWLTVTKASDPLDSPVEGLERWDFCSYQCLTAWAGGRALDQHIRVYR